MVKPTQQQNPADYGRVRQPYLGEVTANPEPSPAPVRPDPVEVAKPTKPVKE